MQARILHKPSLHSREAHGEHLLSYHLVPAAKQPAVSRTAHLVAAGSHSPSSWFATSRANNVNYTNVPVTNNHSKTRMLISQLDFFFVKSSWELRVLYLFTRLWRRSRCFVSIHQAQPPGMLGGLGSPSGMHGRSITHTR